MIAKFEQVLDLFGEIDKAMQTKIDCYMIGGAVLLEQGLKPATKDIDLIVTKREDFIAIERALKSIGFKPKIPGKEYSHFDLSQILQRDDYRIDIFNTKVCGKFSLSSEMKKRAKKVKDYNNLYLFSCSNEDIFIFKSMTEREGDLTDSKNIILKGVDWNTILEELKAQIKHSGKNVWITWIGERLDLLEEQGIMIPIMKEVDKMRDDFFKERKKE